MDNFIVSARKYRPVTFESVVGQGHITGTLKNAIKNNQLAQAFLFCGPRGVGKTTCARILAKTINCQNPNTQLEPCGTCESCVSFQQGNSFSIHELDAASNNSVEDIRNLTEQVRIPPQTGKFKIYIIDEVHMLSSAAFNAFLKTLEEPPAYAIFILATTEKHKIIPTILSRCQIFDFNRIKVEDMARHLAAIADKESIAYDMEGLHLIAQKADGGLRDALSMFDQIASFSNRNITYQAVIDNLNILDYDYYFKVTDALLTQDVASGLLLFDEILSKGFDGNHFITGLASHLRNLLVGKDQATLRLLEVSEGIKQKYLIQSEQTDASFLVSALNIANQCDLNYRTSKNQRLQVELSLIKIAHLHSALHLSAVAPAADVKKKLNSPASAVASAPAAEKKPEKALKPEVEPIKEVPTAITEPEPLADKIAEPILAEPETVYENPAPEPEKSAEIPAEEKPKPSLNAPAISLIPNLNELISTEIEEKKPDYLTGDSQEDFNQDVLLNRWNEYAERMKKVGKINLFTLLTTNAPVLMDGFKIELAIENKIQETQLQDERIDLMNFLRTELNNFQIELITKIVENTEKKRLYTSTEKYLHMVEKNPKVEEFRKRFNLDLEM
ncbi:MAG: DNA polymerase III subunit gamma/tau [Sphingobacteriaceae bacterium]